MRRPDTEEAAGPRGFATTAWSLIRQAQSASLPKRRRALEQLVAVYWRPVYWTIRLHWRAEPEDARDLTQEFFAGFLEKHLYLKADEAKGHFRGYVKEALKNFLLMRKRARRRLKRGGGIRIVSLENLEQVEREGRRREEPADRQFDRDLMRAILDACLESLREECAAGGAPWRFEAFRDFYLADRAGGPPTYEDLQKRLGRSLHEIKNALHAMRRSFREHVLSHLRDGTSSEEELTAEIRELFQE